MTYSTVCFDTTSNHHARHPDNYRQSMSRYEPGSSMNSSNFCVVSLRSGQARRLSERSQIWAPSLSLSDTVEKSKIVNRSTPSSGYFHLGCGLWQGISLSVAIFGGYRNWHFAIASLIGGARRDNADIKPLGLVFGSMCPIGTACVCHDRGCGRRMVLCGGGCTVGYAAGRRTRSLTGWVTAFVWVTAAARRGLMALNKPLPSPETIVGLGVRAGRIVQ
ncbi:hypothetical protein NA56DRAFT_707791 [Hyaloscypha hepaticicola]|uniref:Uncharacterized protein n=1 Tax=Hyaloscypha hepaticicola TaxID=2082293 RepID=A0A2J6PTH8_9HELO|nr:hypothetical protein NA56DRAFT_707791 [Hyaloscypha hepaticicola]